MERPSDPRQVAMAPQPSKGSRPFQFIYIGIFALFSLAGLYFLRIENTINGVPLDFEKICMEHRWPDGTAIKQAYTRIKAVDFVLSWLVPAFITGSAGWDQGVRLQQINFLVNFFAIVCLWNIEAARRRNQGRIITYTAVWAVFYQTVAGAAIIPLFYLAYTVTSTRDGYLSSGRAVPQGYAKAILPATVIGYLIPTVAMYLPWDNLDMTQNLTALWQVAPLLPNILLLVLAPLLSPRAPSPHFISENRDVKHLRRTYLAIGIVSTITQITTLYICFTSQNPQLSFRYVFLPNKSMWKQSTALGLHYIFLWDFWIIYASSLVWCWLVVMDALRSVHGYAKISDMIISVVNLICFSVVVGPGTVMALVWDWRERYLIQIEAGAQKSKTA